MLDGYTYISANTALTAMFAGDSDRTRTELTHLARSLGATQQIDTFTPGELALLLIVSYIAAKETPYGN